jgi:large subunit ribosomal protein L23
MARVKTRKNRPAPAPRGPQLEPHQVILRPMVTEKGLFFSQVNNQYTFEVNPLASKTDIKQAVESLFQVEVAKVMTQNRKGKPRRYRFRYGRTKGIKKAIVKLKGDHKIDFF